MSAEGNGTSLFLSLLLCLVLELLCVCGQLTRNTGAKLVGELGDEVIVYSVLHWAQNDNRPCVVNCIGHIEDMSINIKTHKA